MKVLSTILLLFCLTIGVQAQTQCPILSIQLTSGCTLEISDEADGVYTDFIWYKINITTGNATQVATTPTYNGPRGMYILVAKCIQSGQFDTSAPFIKKCM